MATEGVAEAEFTVRVAAPLLTLPAELLTTTANLAPLSVLVVAGVVYEEDVAPEIVVLFFCHW
jgi:hypothetical protein